jgi:hypothetical protein
MELVTRQDAGSYALYHYDPSITAAAVFVLLFSATTIFHSWQAIRLRCGIATPLVVGGLSKSLDSRYIDPSVSKIVVRSNFRCLVEVIGFTGRIMSGRESPNWTLGPYIIQAILLLVAPVSRSVIFPIQSLPC